MEDLNAFLDWNKGKAPSRQLRRHLLQSYLRDHAMCILRDQTPFLELESTTITESKYQAEKTYEAPTVRRAPSRMLSAVRLGQRPAIRSGLFNKGRKSSKPVGILEELGKKRLSISF